VGFVGLLLRRLALVLVVVAVLVVVVVLRNVNVAGEVLVLWGLSGVL
jgi:hypothetical protein